MSTDTHLISTSNPASPDEPQPVRTVEEGAEQPSQVASATMSQIVVIQPPPSDGETTEVKPEAATSEVKKKRKKEKKMKKDKRPRKSKMILEQTPEEVPQLQVKP